jgi:hypothetical protein
VTDDEYQQTPVFELGEDENVTYVHHLDLNHGQGYDLETQTERAIVRMIYGAGQILMRGGVSALSLNANVEVPPHSSYRIESLQSSDSSEGKLAVSIYGISPVDQGGLS